MIEKPWKNQHVHTCKEHPDDFCNACYQVAYRKDNRVTAIKYGRNRYSQNREEIAQNLKKKYREDPAYRQKILAKAKRYYQKNREKILGKDNKRRSKYIPGGNRAMYREMVINLLIQRDGPNCGICGKPVDFKDATIDHILELYKDGDHNAKNLRLAHKSCNLSRPRLDLKPKHYDYTIE